MTPKKFNYKKVSNLQIGDLYITELFSKALITRTEPDNLGVLSLISAKYPTRPKNLANKGYVDAAIAGVRINFIVDHASTENINLATDVEAGDPIDQNLILAVGEYILVKDQINQTENGIYIVNQSGPPTRVNSSILANGQNIYVQEGETNEGSVWVSNGSYVVPNYGTDNITFGSVEIWPQAPFGGTNGSGGTGSIVVGPGQIVGNPSTGSAAAVGVTLGSNFILSGAGTLSLGTSGVVAGTYNTVTVNSQGLVIAGTSVTLGTGTVTNIATGTGLVGGPITNSGTIQMGNSGVTAGTYGNSTNIVQISVDALGRILTATNVPITTGTGFDWVVVPTTTQNMNSGTGYIVDNPALTILELPTIANPGDIVAIAGANVGGWKIIQNANQTIHFGYKDSTTGTGGFLASTYKYDYVELLCIVANTDFLVKASIGNLDLE